MSYRDSFDSFDGGDSPRVEDEDPSGTRKSRRSRPRSAERRSLVRLRVNNFKLEEVEKIHLPPVAYEHRKCTDVIFLGLFILYWIGMLALGARGYEKGNPARLIYGSDSYGNICGDETGNKADKPFIVFPRLERDLEIEAFGQTIDLNPFDTNFYRLCSAECPKQGEYICADAAEQAIEAHLAADENATRVDTIQKCVNSAEARFGSGDPACPDSKIAKECYEIFFDHESVLFRCFPKYIYNVTIIADETNCLLFRNTTLADGTVKPKCMRYKETTKVVRVEPPDTSILFGAFNSANRVFERIMGDLLKAKEVILGVGIGVAAFVGLLYIGSLRCYIGCMIWTSVLSCVLICFAITIFCYFKAGILTSQDLTAVSASVDDILSGVDSVFGTQLGPEEQERLDQLENGTDITLDSGEELPGFIKQDDRYADGFRYTAYAFTGVTFFVSIIIILLRTRINRSIEFFKEASRAVKSNPTILLVPPVSIAVSIGVIFYWVTATLYLSSAGDVELVIFNASLEDDLIDTKTFVPLSNLVFFNVFLFAGFVWTMSFVNGLSLMTIAGVVGRWYWSGSPRDWRSPGGLAISRSFCTAIMRHCGTVAFGAVLISFSQLIRYLASFFQARINKSRNSCVRTVLCSLRCCFKCAENCIKFISRNAYIITVLYGTTFCVSTRMAFAAFATNLAQVATITFLGDIIVRFGQFFITFTSAFIAWTILDGQDVYKIGGEKELSSTVFPTFITAWLAWYTAHEVLAVYDVCIDTILVSFCQDRKLVKLRHAHHKEVVAHHNMQKFVERHQLTPKQLARRTNVSVIA